MSVHKYEAICIVTKFYTTLFEIGTPNNYRDYIKTSTCSIRLKSKSL